jgi:hypothetical protein
MEQRMTMRKPGEGNETTIGWSLGNPALFKDSLQIAITCL